MRKLASVERILSISPIPGADAIEVVKVKGWSVVVKKGEYSVGDEVIYLEVDSWVPESLAPFLTPKGQEAKEYQGVKGNRLRTVKLRGQISQGLLLPITSDLREVIDSGKDLAEALGVLKYEPPIPAQLSGGVKGLFPSFIPKIDEERVQNLDYEEILRFSLKNRIYATEKLDGTSMTVYINNGEFGICSRNLEMKLGNGTSFDRVAKKLALKEKMENLGGNLAIQGELIGPGIQKNRYKLSDLEFRPFTVYFIDEGKRANPKVMNDLLVNLGLKMVPVLWEYFAIPDKLDSLIELASRKSALNNETPREGIVVRSFYDDSLSFKVISNEFLLKTGG